MSKRPSLLILELTSENKEAKSEGWLLWELMRILELKKRVRFEKVRDSGLWTIFLSIV